MERAKTAIIGGTAAYYLDPTEFGTVLEEKVETTPYGDSPPLFLLQLPSGLTVWYSSRHGKEQLNQSARFVNQRAHLWALYQLGVYQIFSWNGVGAINPQLKVGQLLVPTKMLDWTRNRIYSFAFDLPGIRRAARARKAARTIDHINEQRDPRRAANPFLPQLCEAINRSLPSQPALPNFPLTYLCTEGPRLETAAEINLAAHLGADCVGMTLSPEIWLAMELGISYASLCVITNFATGRSHHDARRNFGADVGRLCCQTLLKATINLEKEF